jgi:hypothetical protein
MTDFDLYWILDGHRPRHPRSNAELSEWWRRPFDETRRVARDTVGEVDVSTVFLTIDHNWSPDGPPVLFETMLFASESWSGGPAGAWHDNECWRYSTWDEAVAGHQRVVAALR